MTNKDKKFIIRIFAILPLFAVGVLLSFISVSTALASTISPSDVVVLANSARVAEGLAPLVENGKLSLAAKAKAEDMLKNDYFAHTSSDGITPWHWIKQVGYQYKAAGENLAINFDSAKEQHNAWMKSATHRANILNGQYKEIGVAVVKGKIDGKESVVTVEFFGTPFYAAAEQINVMPPAVQKVPAEIKGMETQTEIQTPSIVPVLPPENVISQQVIHTLPTKKILWMDIAIYVFTAILALNTFAAPIAFLVIAYMSLITLLQVKNTKIIEVFESQLDNVPRYR